MSRRRFIALSLAAVLALSGALYLSAQRNLQRDLRGALLLPSLAGELSTVTAVSLRRGGAVPTVTLHATDGHWTVAERADYPADVSTLRKLLLALSDAKIVEEKTANPASFSIIGVEDPSSTNVTGTEISFTARDGKHAVIVGKAIGAGNFARRVGENTSYSVEPGITFETEPGHWIESKLIDISAAGIQSVQVKPATGTGYSIRHRSAAGANAATANAAGGGDFILDGVPAGRKAADPAVLAPAPSMLSALTAEDVSPSTGIDFSRADVATVSMADGNVITLTGAASGDKHWIQVQASKDPALSAKAAGRAFEIASYRFDAIFRPVEQLLVPKPAPPAANKLSPTKRPVLAPKP